MQDRLACMEALLMQHLGIRPHVPPTPRPPLLIVTERSGPHSDDQPRHLTIDRAPSQSAHLDDHQPRHWTDPHREMPEDTHHLLDDHDEFMYVQRWHLVLVLLTEKELTSFFVFAKLQCSTTWWSTTTMTTRKSQQGRRRLPQVTKSLSPPLSLSLSLSVLALLDGHRGGPEYHLLCLGSGRDQPCEESSVVHSARFGEENSDRDDGVLRIAREIVCGTSHVRVFGCVPIRLVSREENGDRDDGVLRIAREIV
ncbi:hypothetical protein Scep_001575 [Stephania cephalantha]|uniref:Uncharacterized protein n=1 Tax=Stephania cephalantha TaxID=152367 RepID=A0AAP0LC11_9MAGN